MRLIQPDSVVPALHDRQIVGLLRIAAEMNGDAAILGFLSGDVVDRVGVVRVLLEESLTVIEADGPEPVDRHVFDGECTPALQKIRRSCGGLNRSQRLQ